ncbi:MAG TPA: 50S ribosomal protein L6 [Candidatus Saccharimonadales bacterium]|nr:50S ribosomal protein L6 [Candidatus Saccharimonadales bacterium]
MSRIGKSPINVPAGVEVEIDASVVHVKGPKGSLEQTILTGLKVEQTESQIQVSIKRGHNEAQAYFGLMRTLIANMVSGVESGFERKLEINGVGYRANVAGEVLNLTLGFSHPIEVKLPAGITASVEKNVVTISGYDKQLVGQVAANIRSLKKPEPYKGKGIKYVEETIRRKAGKAATKG